ncbi:MAG: primosomal protein N' [Cryobacterium sp.]|uniref:primosomal protein N' family DNA-binding protein n=1 Tax=unclassified Cryobacterium TaxID=2649013 RepID=UPI0018CA4EAF|nr:MULTISPECIES: primosomal protein N' [unclassified Cryobacterium]MCY7405778.1 primosomal protein N' [Cryobacterium sp.]MEC5155487.1 primosomal protein N' (replication factor Y) [Cryobacterium sp. CAN_C3]
MTAIGLVARVLIDSPLPQLDHLFDYGIPDELVAHVRAGVRVKVPFRSGGRVIDGYVIEVIDPRRATGATAGAEDLFRGSLSPLDSVISDAAVLTPEVYALARRLADRAAGNASDIIRLAVPPRQVRVEKAWLAAVSVVEPAPITPSVVEPASITPSVVEPASITPSVVEPASTIRSSSVLAGTRSTVVSAAAFVGYPTGRLDTVIMQQQRVAVAAIPELVQLPGGSTIGRWAQTLAELGVAAFDAGRSAILCVPDFRDQDQVQAALDHIAPAGSVQRVDARQPNPDRYRSFLACLESTPRIILGNRSAVYAPAHELGLIAIWDDGDPLYSEPLSPYVHARDAALVRRESAGSALVLLGHTRSVETQRLVELGYLDEAHPAKDRHPRVIPTDFQSEPDEQARAARIPSAAWQAAREAVRHGPVLVQVASPGYAPMLACQGCKKAARCTHCPGPLGLTSASAVPSCRWCGALAAGWSCVHCTATKLRVVTMGTGRTAEELGRAFPGTRVIVADGEHTIQTLGSEPALVIATRGAEPIPTGGYRAILILDGERMLARESLRVGEDCLRWWANAAALAAPGAPVLLAGVGGALARALNAWRPDIFAASELADRRQLRFPPAVRVASVTGTATAVDAALADLAEVGGIDILGPVETEGTLVRAVVRFGYAGGAEVGHALKAAVVRNAARRRKPKSGSFQPAPTLKVRFDDPELL